MNELPEKKLEKTERVFRFVFLYAFIGMIVALYSIAIYSYIRLQIEDNTRINASGRLRMLTQQITKDVILYRDGALAKNNVLNTLEFFHATLHGIARGGAVPMDSNSAVTVKLRAMEGRSSQIILNKALEEWELFRQHVLRFLDRKDPVSLRYILDNNENLLWTIESAVTAINKYADKDQMEMGLIIASAILLVIAAIAVSMVRQVKRYRRAETRLAEIEQLLPICSSCKKIRTDNDHPENPRSWTSIDEYLRDKKDMVFTHSICPDCMMKLYPGMFKDDTKKE
ncbi:MAG TPA: type IV pili methyl-accepting chemotaxis transducer N-terminal domain-containing protein [Spirochaetota bacterium]|nr:type IV pili methyl-accepting chemotaxis transducer N-terminal domain-containing protein [Spirochaetota bacterium]